MKHCYDCGKKATRELRLTDDGKLDMLAPYKPVCDECYPWNAIFALDSGGQEVGIWREILEAETLAQETPTSIRRYAVFFTSRCGDSTLIEAERFAIESTGVLAFWIADRQVAAFANGSWTRVRPLYLPDHSDEALDD